MIYFPRSSISLRSSPSPLLFPPLSSLFLPLSTKSAYSPSLSFQSFTTSRFSLFHSCPNKSCICPAYENYWDIHAPPLLPSKPEALLQHRDKSSHSPVDAFPIWLLLVSSDVETIDSDCESQGAPMAT